MRISIFNIYKIVVANAFFVVCLLLMNSCSDKTVRISYDKLYDPIADVGQYRIPALSKTPRYYLEFDMSDSEGRKTSLRDYLLAASINGLASRAIECGKNNVGFWFDVQENHSIPPFKVAYEEERMSLLRRGCEFIGYANPIALATRSLQFNGVNVDLKPLFKGYILTDLDENPESANVAVTASHVYNAIIVDKQDKDLFDKVGYKMVYDASQKNVRDAWNEFKNKCAHDGLVIMPNNTWQLRDIAIMNGWFCMNLYPIPHNNSKGDYWDLYSDVCQTMTSHSLVYGWESGVHNEHEINEMVSSNALASAVNDWHYNDCLMSADYKHRQESVLTKVLDPKHINYNKKKRFVSFFMTDGDNNQWMMNNFLEQYFEQPEGGKSKIAFGIPSTTMPQMSPAAYQYLINHQQNNTTLVEVQGGGVFYIDTYAKNRNRRVLLKERAELTATWMRQHRIKVLGLMAKEDVGSQDSKEGYKAFIEANNQLIGIIAIQYTPYAGGKGDIYWFKNADGYDIPVITVKYSLWNESYLREREGTPHYIAKCLDKDNNNRNFNLVAIHAWSSFSDQGQACDDLAETKDSNIRGCGIARLLENHLDSTYEVVSLEELIWQLRMQERPQQIRKYLKSLL